VSADELKAETDRMSQEHNTAARELAERAQQLHEFVEAQKKNRTRVRCVDCSVPRIFVSFLMLHK